MAKKTDVNQSKEIRDLVKSMGKDASFRDVFGALKKNFEGHRFNENSCKQAYALGRRAAGFTRGKRVQKRKPGRPPGSVGRPKMAASSTRPAASGNGILQIIRAAKDLIAASGSTSAAKA